MNLTHALGQSEVVQKLGWMLLHSLWQGAAGAFVLWVFLLITRGLRGEKWSRVRYSISCAMLLAVVLASVATFLGSMQSKSNMPRSPSILPVNATPVDIMFASIPAPIPSPPAKFDPHTLIPITVYIWAIGVVVQSLFQCAGWLRLRRLRQGLTINDPVWIDALQQTAAGFKIRRIVRLVVGAIDVPAVIGAFRPVIIIPLALVNELSPQQVQAVLAHELAHIRRWDYAVNLLQTAVETLYFYHPAVWWISSQIRLERENCCDDIAANLCGDRKRYAAALVKLEERRADSPRLALAATDGSLIDRVRRLLAVPSPAGGRGRSILIAVLGLICVIVPIGWQRVTRAQATKPVAAVPSTLPEDSRPEAAGHVIAAGDTLIMSVMDSTRPSAGTNVEIVQVSDEGEIKINIVTHPIHAAGLTAAGLSDVIAKAYRDGGWASDPKVKIELDHRAIETFKDELQEQQRLLAEDQALLRVYHDREMELDRQLESMRTAIQAEHGQRPTTAPSGLNTSLTQDDLILAGQLAKGNPQIARVLKDRQRYIDQDSALALDGYTDKNPTVKALRQQLADIEGNLREAVDSARAHPPGQVIRVTIGDFGFISVDGGVGNWDTLRERLSITTPAERANDVIAISAETPDVPAGDIFAAKNTAEDLVKEFGLADVTVGGIEVSHPSTRPKGDVVFLQGLVRQPGEYLLEPDKHRTLSTMIGIAGGFSQQDAMVALFRQANGARKVMFSDVSVIDINRGISDLYAQPDDMIVVYEPKSATTRPHSVIYIGGKVRRAGVYSIEGIRETISQQLISAGGVNGPDESHAWVTLIRRVDGRREEVLKNIPIFDIQNGKTDPYLEPDDTVEVSTSDPAMSRPD